MSAGHTSGPDPVRDDFDAPFDPAPADPCEAAAALALLDLSGEAGDDGRARLAAHRAACPRCAAEGEALAADAARLGGALRAAAPSADLAEAVLARIRAGEGGEPAAPPLRLLPGGRGARVAVATAAAVLLVAAVGVGPALSGRWGWWGRDRETPRPGTVSAGFVPFADATDAAGIGFRHHGPTDRIAWMAESVGSGAAAADLDGDGLPDLLLADAWPLGAGPPAGAGCRLYRNRGDGTFEDRTDGSGVVVPERVCGVVAADLDNDGLRDLVLAGYGRLRVLRNLGGMRFEDLSDAAGLAAEPDSWFSCAAAADFDRDGVLDLFVTRYADQETYRRLRGAVGADAGREGIWRGLPVFAGPTGLAPQTARLYRGLPGLRFEDRSAGLEGLAPRWGFQAIATDADGDGWIDVYAANDTQPNDLWRNLGGLRFRNVGVEAGCAYDRDGKAQAGMGVAAGDPDGDGLPDLLVTNFSNDHLTLYANRGRPGAPAFEDRSYPSGIGVPSSAYLGWGAVFEDLDRDGEEDAVVAAGHLYPNVSEMPGLGVSFAEPLLVFRGLGGGAFEDRTGRDRVLATPRAHRGLATLDFDGDGRTDLLATTVGGPPALLRNLSGREGGRGVAFRLVGTRSPRDAAGARVTVLAGGRTRTRELHLGSSYACTSEPVLRFGLGAADRADRVVVRWPSGQVQEIGPLPADRVHEVVEPR